MSDTLAEYDLSLLPERILSKIVIAPGCWLWQGFVCRFDGYGRVGMPQSSGKRRWQSKVVHRVVYEALVGPIPEGLTLDHVYAWGCRNRHCVWPGHLEPVTRGVNTMRGVTGVSYINSQKDHCPEGHEYTEENTRHVQGKRPGRKCRTCIRARNYETRFGRPHPTGGVTPLRITSLSPLSRDTLGQ